MYIPVSETCHNQAYYPNPLPLLYISAGKSTASNPSEIWILSPI
jgi:hypothetical protein